MEDLLEVGSMTGSCRELAWFEPAALRLAVWLLSDPSARSDRKETRELEEMLSGGRVSRCRLDLLFRGLA